MHGYSPKMLQKPHAPAAGFSAAEISVPGVGHVSWVPPGGAGVRFCGVVGALGVWLLRFADGWDRVSCVLAAWDPELPFAIATPSPLPCLLGCLC